MLPVSHEVLLAELETAGKILSKWKGKVDDGIPSIDVPANPESLENFIRELCGELLVVAGKCETLSNVLAGEL